MIDPELVASEAERFASEVKASAQRHLDEKKHFFVEPESLYLNAGELAGLIALLPVVNIEPLRSEGAELATETNIEIRQEISARKGEELFRPLADRVAGWLEEGSRVYVTAHNKAQPPKIGAVAFQKVLNSADVRSRRLPGAIQHQLHARTFAG